MEEEQEIRNNNGVTEIKTDKFIYKHKHSFGRSGETVFDLYTDFEKIKEHIIKYNFLNKQEWWSDKSLGKIQKRY